MALCYTLCHVQDSMGKQALFQRAPFGYNFEEMQEFLMNTHHGVAITECMELCVSTRFCGSVVYARSSQICTLLTASGADSIPVLAIATKSDDAQVWIPGKKLLLYDKTTGISTSRMDKF